MNSSTSTPLTPEHIQHFIPFDELSLTAIAELIPHFRYYRLEQKKILFKRGDHDDECHFLLNGTIDLADDQFNITTLRSDDIENFLALDASHTIHRNTGITQTSCEFFAIKRQYLELISTWAELAQSWQEDDHNTDWLESLLTSELFSRIPPANIQKLLSRFQERTVRLGEVIINEGDESHECYVIKRGKALVTRLQNGKNTTLAAISNGDLFGEDGLISNLPRNASITMSSDGIVMVLAEDDFNTLLKDPILNYIGEEDLTTLILEGDTGTVLLDVRLPQEVVQNPIHRAICIPLAQLRSRLGELNKAFVHVLIGGGRAEAAAYILSDAGFETRILKQAEQ